MAPFGARTVASWIRVLLTSTFLAFCIETASAQAAPAPIVFDFEDGLQGWTLGQASRQQELIEGDFAIFGIDSSFMSLDIDLTDIRAMTLDRFFTGSNPRRQNFLTARVRNPLIPIGGSTLLGFGESLLATESNPNPNPDTLWFDLSEISGLRTVLIEWDALVCGLPDESCFGINFPGYVDNITFHPVPEPSTLGLLAFGFAALVCARQRM